MTMTTRGAAVVDVQHPYDEAFGMMQKMQTEITELRTALHAEQQQRAREVSDLRREVINLQDQLHKCVADLKYTSQTVSCALTSETALRGKAMEKLHGEVEDAIRKAQEVESLKHIQATQFGKLATELKAEKRDRMACQQELNTKLAQETFERREEEVAIKDDLQSQRDSAQKRNAEDKSRMDFLTHNLQLAGQLLNTGDFQRHPHSNDRSGTAKSTASTAFSPNTTLSAFSPNTTLSGASPTSFR